MEIVIEICKLLLYKGKTSCIEKLNYYIIIYILFGVDFEVIYVC